MRIFLVFLSLVIVLISCTKEQGKNPALAYGDAALLDSCLNTNHVYYKNDATTILSGAHGPHGTFKLRFNSVANKALTDNGKLPQGSAFPEGSFIIKDIYGGGNVTLYAFMYKYSGSWIWGEIYPDGKILHSVNGKESVCTGCHSQSGNRDLVVSFNFY